VDLNQNFDYEKYHLCTIQNNIIEHLEKGKVKIEPVKDAEVVKAIKNLKIGKSPDIDGITAEHYKNVSAYNLPHIEYYSSNVTTKTSSLSSKPLCTTSDVINAASNDDTASVKPLCRGFIVLINSAWILLRNMYR
jgi:hypothetical protein